MTILSITYLCSHTFRILLNSLDEKMMRIQDTIPMLANIVRVHARKDTWEFVVKNYKRFRER